jgi:subtilase family serine protease
MSEEPLQVEESEEIVSEMPVKKFTPFQWTVIGLLGGLILVLIAFLIVYALKGSGDDQVTEDTTNSLEDENVIDTSVQPPSVVQESQMVSENETGSRTNTEDQVKKADLYVKSYDLDEVPELDDEFTARIIIGNKGTTASQSFAWEWWATESDRACKGDVGGLAVGETTVIECDHTYDDADNFATKVVVDAKDEVDESNENNNSVAKEIEVLEKADLYISEYSFDHDPVQGEEFTVSITFKNKGETDAEDFYWEWWPTVTGSKACREKIDKIDAGEKVKVECDYTYGGWANYTTKAVVDADDDVDEDDEGNNTYTKDVVPIH